LLRYPSKVIVAEGSEEAELTKILFIVAIEAGAELGGVPGFEAESLVVGREGDEFEETVRGLGLPAVCGSLTPKMIVVLGRVFGDEVLRVGLSLESLAKGVEEEEEEREEEEEEDCGEAINV